MVFPCQRIVSLLFPGNHDINRSSVNPDAQETITRMADASDKYAQEINQRFNDRPAVFKEVIKRLDEIRPIRSILPAPSA